MKSTAYSLKAIILGASAATAITASACGPWNPIIPTPEFFYLPFGPTAGTSSIEKEENLRLWQKLTSERIPTSHIEKVVYHDSPERVQEYVATREMTEGNLMRTYLANCKDTELTDFLYLAKRIEKLRDHMNSPWYYPESRDSGDNGEDFDALIAECRAYSGERLKDRYALQVTRALFATRRYAECIVYTDSAFAGFPDCNLMKRMARRYAAGCLRRIGEKERADTMFAKAGDIWSISGDNPIELMATLNPGNTQLIEYVRTHATDTLFMVRTVPIAMRLLKDRRVKNYGDWNFMLAYTHNEYMSRLPQARMEISRALSHKFSSQKLKDLAHAYKMKLDARAGDRSSLISDLKWIEEKCDPLNVDAKEWTRLCRNVIYVDWLPHLWKKKDYSTAILLASYADRLDPSRLRLSPLKGLDIDYGSLSFQMMGSISSSQLAAAYGRIMDSSPLHRFLRRKACTDPDYYNELIGTLALREENYARAISYLSRVSLPYLRSMNIDKDGYLSRNPFTLYPSRWGSYTFRDEYEGGNTTWEWENATARHACQSNPTAKLDFARKMLGYKKQMQSGKTANERGIARLMYAIGRRNSFEECWALTQYWRGWVGIFEPGLQYWEDSFASENYAFLYDYNTTVGHRETEDIYEKEVSEALAMLRSDEARAKANYILGNLRTIVKRYGNTGTGRFVKTSCDNWRQWI